jgi:hypothetical protein
MTSNITLSAHLKVLDKLVYSRFFPLFGVSVTNFVTSTIQLVNF